MTHVIADCAVTARSLPRRLKKPPHMVVNARSGPEGYRNCESETKGCTRCRKRRCWGRRLVRSDVQTADFTSVPAQRVGCRDGRGDVGCPGRVTHATSAGPATAMTVTAACCAVAGHVTAQQSPAHEGRATGLTHRRAMGDGTGAGVCLLPPLVSPSNDEHGSTVGSRDDNSTHGNTGSLSSLARG